MKNKLMIATSFLLVAAGTAAASPMEMNFNDDFFGDGPFFDDDSSEDDSSDDFFGDDDFFNDGPEDDESGDESEGDVGVCVIGVDSPCNSEEYDGDNETDDNTGDDETNNETDTVSEERHVTPAPEPDGVGENWISYPNPRDHVLDYETISERGDIKVCQVLLNEENQVITGETV